MKSEKKTDTYAMGYTKDSTGERPVIVTLSLLGNTDIVDLQRKPVNFKLPFFQRFYINCGYFKDITSMDENVSHESCYMIINTPEGEQEFKIERGKYFCIDNYDYELKIGLPIYPYKTCVINNTRNFVGDNYTGVITKHYEGGNIFKRMNYLKGDLANEKIYRDNEFNTLWAVITYKKGVIEQVYHYDLQENTLGQAFYNSNGACHHHLDQLPPSEILQLSALNLSKAKMVEIQEVQEVDTGSEEESLETEDDDTGGTGGAGGSGSSGDDSRVKTKVNNEQSESEPSESEV